MVTQTTMITVAVQVMKMIGAAELAGENSDLVIETCITVGCIYITFTNYSDMKHIKFVFLIIDENDPLSE